MHAIMIKKSMGMLVLKSQPHKKTFPKCSSGVGGWCVFRAKEQKRRERPWLNDLRMKELRFNDDVVLDVLSLDSRFNAKKVMCGLMHRRRSSDVGNVVLCVCNVVVDVELESSCTLSVKYGLLMLLPRVKVLTLNLLEPVHISAILRRASDDHDKGLVCSLGFLPKEIKVSDEVVEYFLQHYDGDAGTKDVKDSVRKNKGVPLHLRNAPTKLMKELRVGFVSFQPWQAYPDFIFDPYTMISYYVGGDHEDIITAEEGSEDTHFAFSNTPPDSYFATSHFGGVTDWYKSRGYREPDTIMSYSEDSTVTYTTVSSPYEGQSGDVSPGVDGPPVMPEDPYAYVVAAFQALPPPDYVLGPEEPEQAPPSPVYIPYVPELVYPEYIPPEDDVFPAEEQPLPAAASPTADSPGYIPESDPDEDPEDDDDEDLEEDPANYPADHDDDEEEEEPSGDDADEEDKEQDEDDDDEEEEHPASADSIPPLPALRVTAMISFRPQPPTLFFTKEEAERADRPEVTLPPQKRLNIIHGPGYKAGESSVAAAEAALTTLEGVNTRVTELAAVQEQDTQDIYGVMEDTQGRQAKIFQRVEALVKRLNIIHGPGYKAGESSVAAAVRPMEGRRADYRFVNSVEAEAALTTLEGVNTRVTELAAMQEQDTQDIYGVMEDTQGRQAKIFQRVEALVDDRHYHYETGRLVEQEAIFSREAWTHSMGLATLTTQLSSPQGHFKRYCPKLKNNNNNYGNQVGTGNAQARVYAVGNAGTNPDANTITGTFLLNNCYTSVLFDTGADRSFASTAYSSQFDIAPTVLDHDYAVELADGRIVGVNTVIHSCTLNFLNHPFNIDLMSVKMGSFDVIVGMDWLSRYQAVIVCADKIVRIPWDAKSFLAHVTMKEAEGKSVKKKLENVPMVWDFPEVFPEDLPSLPLTR
nr:hypothetical protein [Tanacetum cinerariifolium]